jgi:hypothetical protein
MIFGQSFLLSTVGFYLISNESASRIFSLRCGVFSLNGAAESGEDNRANSETKT